MTGRFIGQGLTLVFYAACAMGGYRFAPAVSAATMVNVLCPLLLLALGWDLFNMRWLRQAREREAAHREQFKHVCEQRDAAERALKGGYRVNAGPRVAREADLPPGVPDEPWMRQMEQHDGRECHEAETRYRLRHAEQQMEICSLRAQLNELQQRVATHNFNALREKRNGSGYDPSTMAVDPK